MASQPTKRTATQMPTFTPTPPVQVPRAPPVLSPAQPLPIGRQETRILAPGYSLDVNTRYALRQIRAIVRHLEKFLSAVLREP